MISDTVNRNRYKKKEKVFTKKDLKLKAQEMKLEEKQRKLEEKAAIREEKERIKNSFGRKVRNFVFGIIFVIILLLVGFYFGQKFLTSKEKELYDEKMNQIYNSAVVSIKEKDYKKGIEQLKSISEKYSKYSDVKAKLRETNQLYLNEYLTEADSYLKDKKFDKAQKILDEIDNEFKNEEIILEKKSEIIVEKIKTETKDLAEKKDNLEVLEYLSKIDSKDSKEIEKTVEELTSKYKNDFILEARELIKTNLSSAELKINSASKLFPKDKDIQKLEEELKEAKKAKKESEEKLIKDKLLDM